MPVSEQRITFRRALERAAAAAAMYRVPFEHGSLEVALYRPGPDTQSAHTRDDFSAWVFFHGPEGGE